MWSIAGSKPIRATSQFFQLARSYIKATCARRRFCQCVITLGSMSRLGFVALFSGRPWIRIADREQKSPEKARFDTAV